MASEDLFEPEYSEEADLEPEQIRDTDITEDTGNEEEKSNGTNTEKPKPAPAELETEAKLTQLPLARIRNIMKLDPDLQMASNEAIFAVTKAVELFVASLARESYSYTAQAKKKTIQKRDVDMAISAVDSLMFLDGAMTF